MQSLQSIKLKSFTIVGQLRRTHFRVLSVFVESVLLYKGKDLFDYFNSSLKIVLKFQCESGKLSVNILVIGVCF